MRQSPSFIIVVHFACVVVTAVSAQGATGFSGLGHLPGGNPVFSFPVRISDDGQTVLGSSNSSAGQVGFLWTQSNGIQPIPMPPGSGNPSQSALGITADGSVVVGGAWGPMTVPFHYSAATGSVPFPTASPGVPTTAVGIAPDGQLTAGFMVNNAFASNLELVTWDAAGLYQTGVAVAGPNYYYHMNVSLVGHVVAGTTISPHGTQGFTWSATSGLNGLGDLPGGGFGSTATDISADGRVVVGTVTSAASVIEAARWTDTTGWVPLGSPFGATYGSQAEGVSSDGSIIVGMTNSPSGSQGFIWDAVHGMRLASDVLTSLRVDFAGWQLTDVNDVSAAGLYITGSGVNPGGQAEAWIASIPEPSWVALPVLVMLVARRKRLPRHSRETLTIRKPPK